MSPGHAYAGRLAEIFGAFESRFAIRFWDGSEFRTNGAGAPVFTILIRHPAALRELMGRPNELRLSRAYMQELIDIEGDRVAAFALVDFLVHRPFGLVNWLRWATTLRSLPRVHGRGEPDVPSLPGPEGSLTRTRDAVRFHYDLPLQFWQLWLDPRLIYSCAYYETPTASLETAQRAKLDHICRKLALRPGEQLLDIGCGWGGLVNHAARYYGVSAHGVTLSEPQATYARGQIAEFGLDQRCSVTVGDFRELPPTRQYDKVASIGAVEHVPERSLPAYFEYAFRALRPGGLFLSQGITSAVSRAGRPKSAFMRRYVFPETHLATLPRMIQESEGQGFETRDVECLREHYALTTRAWLERLEARAEDACRVVGRVTYRKFALMLAGSAYSFATGAMGLYQIVFAKPGPEPPVSLTRRPWYAGGGPESPAVNVKYGRDRDAQVPHVGRGPSSSNARGTG